MTEHATNTDTDTDTETLAGVLWAAGKALAGPEQAAIAYAETFDQEQPWDQDAERQIAAAVLASSWLAGYTARVRAEAVAGVLAQVEGRIMDDPMWIGGDGKPLDYLPERETRIADFLDGLRAALPGHEEGTDGGS